MLPVWLLGILLGKQGSSRPDGAWIRAVSWLRSASLMSRKKSAAEPSLTCERRWLSSEGRTGNVCLKVKGSGVCVCVSHR